MPDWFYRTVTRPILFQFSPSRARDLALGFMARLSRFPGGTSLIDFLGHMRADPRLSSTHDHLTFPTIVGLGPYVDRKLVALPALGRFGVGWINAGPVCLEPKLGLDHVHRLDATESLVLPEPDANIGLAAALPRLQEMTKARLPLLVQLVLPTTNTPANATEQCRLLIEKLHPHVQMISLPTLALAQKQNWSQEDWLKHLHDLKSCSGSCTLMLQIPLSHDLDPFAHLLQTATTLPWVGLALGSTLQTQAGWEVGKSNQQLTLQLLQELRTSWGPDGLIIASGGVHEPIDALRLHQAGATLIEVDTGLIFTGPGLPKRINEALLFQNQPDHPPPPPRTVETTWFWTFLMGLGMFVGSLLALAFAATTVILPYDETFLGKSRQELDAINRQILPFMAHDRVTLAGAMIAVGVMYIGLSWFGIRRGLHWARVTVIVSATIGFLSFFLFLGFGYLDPFHAFVTVVLLQFLLLGVIGKSLPPHDQPPPDLRTDLPWKQSQWGQLFLILHASGLILAGIIISIIGVTQVFVPEDLMFMQTTAAQLREADARLVPLIAHDRATLGGMLLSWGVTLLLPSLWGFRRGSAWLWWTLMIAGCSAYFAAIAVHYLVGYTHLFHLLPAFLGCGLFLLGMVLSFPYLGIRHLENEQHWRSLRLGTYNQ